MVAPSRARGLKHPHAGQALAAQGRAFTGAWVETPVVPALEAPKAGRAFTGAWVETGRA